MSQFGFVFFVMLTVRNSVYVVCLCAFVDENLLLFLDTLEDLNSCAQLSNICLNLDGSKTSRTLLHPPSRIKPDLSPII